MSGIDEGPVTETQFADLLREDGTLDWLGATDPGEAVPETETPAETEAPVEQPRDDKGRFTKAETPEEAAENEGLPPAEEAEETPAEEPKAPADEDVVLEIDDDLQAVLDKYDGDIGKALKALGESQSMIGRQANEVGDLRRELAELKQLMQQQPQQPQQPQYIGPYVNDIDENPEGLVMEALERGDARTMEAALRSWGEIDPFAASTFLITLQQQVAAAEAAAPAPTQSTTPYEGPTAEQAMSEVVQRHPDAEKYLPQVQQVAQEFPSLRDSMRSGPPAVQAQAFEELLKIAKARSQSSETQSAMRRLVLKTQEEVRAEKAEAAVVSAKNQSAATAAQGDEDFWEAWDREAARYSSGGFHRG